ncbi:MAG: hypothetical protein ACPL28_07715 [bacterium]
MIIFFLLTIYIDNATKLPVGVQANGLGGITTVIDEGLSVFHNPALNNQTKFNFTLSRWLYGTNLINFGASYKNNALGINYLNYGIIQGYDEYGLPTNRFAPYDLSIGIGRSFGPLGFCIKNFQSRVDSVLFAGLTLGMSSYIDLGILKIGAKIDNIGKEFVHNIEVPLLLCIGARFVLPENFDIFLETKGNDFELSTGFLYRYENLKIFLGSRYLEPEEFVEGISLSDLTFSGGLTVIFDEYELGYSFIYTQFSNAHQLGIIFVP